MPRIIRHHNIANKRVFPYTVKNGVNASIKANAPGRLYIFIHLKNAPGRSFSRFFERKALWGEPTTREGVRKRPAAKAERDASQHAVGGIARVPFFPFQIYSSIQAFFFYFCVSTSGGPNTTRPTNLAFWKRPGGRLLPYFCFKKRPGGAISDFFMERPGRRLLRSVRYTRVYFSLQAPKNRSHYYRLPPPVQIDDRTNKPRVSSPSRFTIIEPPQRTSA